MLAAHDTVEDPLDTNIPSDDENITDEQIQALLKQAERNLQERAKGQVNGSSTKRVPQLDVTGIPQPYVRMEGDVAHVDSRRVLDKQDRDLSNRPRKVEDPLMVKQRGIAVSQLPVQAYAVYEEILHIHLKQTSAPSWASTCTP